VKLKPYGLVTVTIGKTPDAAGLRVKAKPYGLVTVTIGEMPDAAVYNDGGLALASPVRGGDCHHRENA